MENFGRYNLCCNPLQLENHRVKKGLRRASVTQQTANNLSTYDYLCTSCRKALGLQNIASSSVAEVIEVNVNVQEQLEDDHTGSTLSSISNIPSGLEDFSEKLTAQTSSLSGLSLGTVLPAVNDAFALLNQSPIIKKHIDNQTYLENKVKKVYDELNTSLGVTKLSDDEINSQNFLELLEKLKTKFKDSNTERSEKIQILTILPETWGLSRVCEVMGCTKYMASTAKSLREKKGILSTPNAKSGRHISNDIISKILEFYISDEISVNMPGMKDYLSIRNDEGKREHIQKRLILSNLKELYELFKEQHPDCRVGFSKFASLRPQHCVLAGSSGTHTICVCSMHQNVKLMMLGCNLAALTDQLITPLETYSNCFKIIICQNPTSDCYFHNCDKCPGIQTLKNLLIDVLDENAIDEITYKYWISKPRTSLETFVKKSSDFVDSFCENITSLLPHNYIAKEQASYLRSLKESLNENEFIVICDFAENYAFVIQNAASGFHWNNSQATVYPVVIYYKKNDELVHKCLVIVSDCLSHDAVAVHEFTRIATNFIKGLSNNASKIIYFSDGAPQQFKNYKNFVNLNYHEEDFGIKAEWHYFASAHGKGPCDGAGGTFKRMAARSSLQLPHDQQISTPVELYEWAKKPNSLPNMSIEFFSNEKYDQAKLSLDQRYSRAKTITGTQKYHCVIPDGRDTLRFKEFSSSVESQIYKIFSFKRVRK